MDGGGREVKVPRTEGSDDCHGGSATGAHDARGAKDEILLEESRTLPPPWVGWGRRMGTTMQRHRPTARRENHKLPAASHATPGE